MQCPDDTFDPEEDGVPHNMNAWGSDRYWSSDADDPPVAVEVESHRWRTFVGVTLASGKFHLFQLERETDSKEQGCWHWRTGEAVDHREKNPSAG
jgi:hypothetical protein